MEANKKILSTFEREMKNTQLKRHEKAIEWLKDALKNE